MATRLGSKMKAKRSIKNEDKGNVKSDVEYDTSILTKPLTTSVNNLQKIIQLYQSATEEVRQYLTYECDILYECRICRNIFRSLSNFILHKRKFCRNKFCPVTYTSLPNNDENYLDVIQKDTCNIAKEITTQGDKTHKKNLNSIIENLAQKKQLDHEIKSLFSGEIKENSDSEPNSTCSKKLDLEYIDGSNCGMYQTLQVNNKLENMKLEIMEMHRLSEGQSAVLGPDGKVTNQKPISGLKVLENNENTFTCPKCLINFSTRKTLLSHIKYKHENSRLVYPCLECSETFATVWSVYRHLYNIHRKTLSEVRKMRSRIQAKAFRQDEVSMGSSKSEMKYGNESDQQKIDEENQAWMDNFESDNDIQMCGGCGRRFERKAALNSHSQTCQKRIAARNIINMNKQKRSATEDKIIDKKNPSKIIKLDVEAEKKYADKQRNPIAKKRKIGIQIRCDYSKSLPSAENEVVKKKIIDPITENSQPFEKKTEIVCLENKHSTHNTQTNFSFDESEVVSIPSSNSSPNKEEQDPLSLKDVQSDADSEIEEILGPIDHSIFGSQSEFGDYALQDNEDNGEQLSNINQNTLKLIRLINSDIPEESLKTTLDLKMTNYVNTKKLQCIPCDAKFGNISKLRHHMSSHFNWTKFRCDICLFKTYDKLDATEHVKKDHNILDFDKIEAVIFQIPDWETIELSSDEFIPIKSVNNNHESSSSASSDSCIVIESDSKISKQHKQKKDAKVVKVKKKEQHINSSTDIKDSLDENQSDNEEYSESHNSYKCSDLAMSQDDDLKKMVYEVIFGQDATPSFNSRSKEKESIQMNNSSDKRTTGQSLISSENLPENGTVMDSKTILNDNASQTDGEDEDIYIVENEELVAVK